MSSIYLVHGKHDRLPKGDWITPVFIYVYNNRNQNIWQDVQATDLLLSPYHQVMKKLKIDYVFHNITVYNTKFFKLSIESLSLDKTR